MQFVNVFFLQITSWKFTQENYRTLGNPILTPDKLEVKLKWQTTIEKSKTDPLTGKPEFERFFDRHGACFQYDAFFGLLENPEFSSFVDSVFKRSEIERSPELDLVGREAVLCKSVGVSKERLYELGFNSACGICVDEEEEELPELE